MQSVDTQKNLLTIDGKQYDLSTPQGFQALSDLWICSSWAVKYAYTFTWQGLPIVQLPEDMVRIQELIHEVKPNVIIETGVYHGGSLIFYASLCKLMGKGKVVGVEIGLKKTTEKALAEHELKEYITVIKGDSVAKETLEQVKRQIQPEDTVLVILDSRHTKQHVAAELERYAPLVSKDSYLVVMDGVIKQAAGFKRAHHTWSWNNPIDALEEFVANNPNFKVAGPSFQFNEGTCEKPLTYCPQGFIKRVR